MAMTLTFGWWLIPLVVTLVSFGWAAVIGFGRGPDPYGAGAVISLMFYMAAAIISLLAWLLWLVIA